MFLMTPFMVAIQIVSAVHRRDYRRGLARQSRAKSLPPVLFYWIAR